MVTRYSMESQYNKFACEDQVVPTESPVGEFVKFEDYAGLQAQVEALKQSVVSARARGNLLHNITLQILQGAELNGSDWDYISEEQVAEIEHRLAEVKARAGRKGFIAGATAMERRQVFMEGFNLSNAADQYANSILKGGV